jgi:hypothetical protein
VKSSGKLRLVLLSGLVPCLSWGDATAATPAKSDPAESVYVVQEPQYPLSKRFELTPSFAFLFGDRFVDSVSIAGAAAYNFDELFAVELIGAYMFPSESGLTQEVLTRGRLSPEAAKLTQLLWTVGVGARIRPISGKVEMFGLGLGRLSLHLGLGFGMGGTRVRCTAGTPLDPNRGFDPASCPDFEGALAPGEFREVYEPARIRPMGTLSVETVLQVSELIGLVFTLRDWIYVARVFRPETTDISERFTDSVQNALFLQFGLRFVLGEGSVGLGN